MMRIWNSVTRMNSRTYFTMEECGVDLKSLVTTEETELFDLLNSRYKNNWIVYSDVEVLPGEEPEVLPDTKKVEEWKDRFRYIFNSTQERYLTIIKLFQEQEANLLNKIGSTTTTKFNDTPQNLGEFELDKYTTTLTQVKTEVDPGELMNRIDNIHNKLDNYYQEWIRRFDDLFGTSTLLED